MTFPMAQIFLTRLPLKSRANSCVPQVKVATVPKIPWRESENPSVSRRYPSIVPVTKSEIKYSKASQITKPILVILLFLSVLIINTPKCGFFTLLIDFSTVGWGYTIDLLTKKFRKFIANGFADML